MEKKSPRYAAKLLFQHRIRRNRRQNQRRPCEERLIVIAAPTASAALAKAKRYAQGQQSEATVDGGAQIYFEFVGVLELLCLDYLVDDCEVWWDVYEKVRPMENRRRLIPNESELRAFVE